MNTKIEKDDDAWEINQKLMAKLHFQTAHLREVEQENEAYKLMIDEMEAIFEDPVQLKEIVSEMKIFDVDKEELENLKQAKESVETMMETIKSSKQIIGQELEELKAKKEATEKENEKLKATVMNLNLEVHTLSNKELPVEANTEQMKKLRDQVAILKLDLKEKCEDFVKLADEYEEFKLQVEKHECVKNRLPPPPPPGFKDNSLQVQTVVPTNVLELSLRFNSLANQYNLVVHDRNQLWTRLNSSENFYSELVSRQQKEIFELKSALNEARLKITRITTQQSMDEVARKCKKLQEDLEQIQQSMNENLHT